VMAAPALTVPRESVSVGAGVARFRAALQPGTISRTTRGVRQLCKLCSRDCGPADSRSWAETENVMIGLSLKSCLSVSGTLVLLTSAALSSTARAASGYEIFVSNEHAGTVTIIEGGTFKVLDTFPVGKRPRG